MWFDQQSKFSYIYKHDGCNFILSNATSSFMLKCGQCRFVYLVLLGSYILLLRCGNTGCLLQQFLHKCCITYNERLFSECAAFDNFCGLPHLDRHNHINIYYINANMHKNINKYKHVGTYACTHMHISCRYIYAQVNMPICLQISGVDDIYIDKQKSWMKHYRIKASSTSLLLKGFQ